MIHSSCRKPVDPSPKGCQLPGFFYPRNHIQQVDYIVAMGLYNVAKACPIFTCTGVSWHRISISPFTSPEAWLPQKTITSRAWHRRTVKVASTYPYPEKVVSYFGACTFGLCTFTLRFRLSLEEGRTEEILGVLFPGAAEGSKLQNQTPRSAPVAK